MHAKNLSLRNKRYRVNVERIAESVAAEFAARRKKGDEPRKPLGMVSQTEHLKSYASGGSVIAYQARHDLVTDLTSHVRGASVVTNKTLDGTPIHGYARFTS